jgi:sugar O-acyltransferase (sialic acid O-acetyltransferase NeuD family)
MRKEIIIFGNGKISETISFYAERQCGYKIAAFTCDKNFIKSSEFLGRPLIDFEVVDQLYPPSKFDFFVAVGYQDLNGLRERKFYEAKAKDYHIISVISPVSGIPENVITGQNCFIGPPALIQPFVEIGDNVFVWPGTVIGHHSEIGNHIWLTAGANIGGNVRIGDNCFIGLNATVSHCISLGSHCFLGANVLVIKNLEDRQVVITESQNPIRLNSDQFLKISKFS